MIIVFLFGYLCGYLAARIVISIRPEDEHVSESTLKNINYEKDGY